MKVYEIWLHDQLWMKENMQNGRSTYLIPGGEILNFILQTASIDFLIYDFSYRKHNKCFKRKQKDTKKINE